MRLPAGKKFCRNVLENFPETVPAIYTKTFNRQIYKYAIFLIFVKESMLFFGFPTTRSPSSAALQLQQSAA